MPQWATTAREVVRGERPWKDLATVGVEVRRSDNAWHFGPWPHDPLPITNEDLAAGFDRHLSRPDHGREWAEFLIAATDLYEVSDDAGLEALWDLSRGNAVAATDFARRA